MPVNPIPAGFEGATPYLRCRDAASAIEFYRKAYGATEIYRLDMPDGKVGHAEIQIAGGKIMLSDEFPEWNCLSPLSVGGASAAVMIYVQDVDAFASQAIAAGAKALMQVTDQFYGDRSCKLQDPFGHEWMFASRIEEVSPEEMQRRCAAFAAECGEGK